MNQSVKNKRKARSSSHRDEEQHMTHTESGSAMESQERSYRSSSSSQNNDRMMIEQPWDYQRVKEVVSAVYTIASLFLNMEQKRKLDKINKDVSAILGVKTLADWVPPQPLLNIIGLEAGEERYSRAA